MKLDLAKYFGNYGGMLVFVLIAVIIGLAFPWFVITSLNALFPVLAIPFTLETWGAVWILNACLRLSITTSS